MRMADCSVKLLLCQKEVSCEEVWALKPLRYRVHIFFRIRNQQKSTFFSALTHTLPLFAPPFFLHHNYKLEDWGWAAGGCILHRAAAHTPLHVWRLLFSSISDRTPFPACDYLLLLKIIFKKGQVKCRPKCCLIKWLLIKMDQKLKKSSYLWQHSGPFLQFI